MANCECHNQRVKLYAKFILNMHCFYQNIHLGKWSYILLTWSFLGAIKGDESPHSNLDLPTVGNGPVTQWWRNLKQCTRMGLADSGCTSSTRALQNPKIFMIQKLFRNHIPKIPKNGFLQHQPFKRWTSCPFHSAKTWPCARHRCWTHAPGSSLLMHWPHSK